MDIITPQPPVAPPQSATPSTPPLSNQEIPQRQSKSIRNIISTVSIILLAPIIALLLIQFVFQSYQVEGPSMQPTLQNNDRLIVLKAPRTWARITGHPYIPNRGDIVIFSGDSIPALSATGAKDLVKRVIGLPGEHVVVKDDIVTVYNKQYPNGFQPDATLPYGKVITATDGDIDITVPANEIFVCGDNRLNSYDSRRFGPVPVSEIVGKLVLRVFPLPQATRF